MDIFEETCDFLPVPGYYRNPEGLYLKMKRETERNLGLQPVAGIMEEHGLKAHDLVAVSTEQITHKMVSRACKGRRLTPNVQCKIRNALNNAAGREYSIRELFTY
jgi:hypothetical protein